jgi:hypothetical protein
LISAVGRAQIRSSVLNPASPGAAMAGLVEPRLLVKGQPGEHLPLGRRDAGHRVVEPGQRDPSVSVVQACQQFGQGVQRVRHRAAERSGVQITPGSAQIDVGCGNAAHAGAHRRHVGCPHRGVRDNDHVAAELFPPGLEQRGEVHRPGLLLALDQQLERDRWRVLPAGRQAGPHAEGMEEDLALVVGGAAGQQLPVPLHRLERRRVPFIQRLDRLHVVVAVDEHGRGRWIGGRPVREHGGQPAAIRAGLPDLGHREACLAEVPGEPFR